MTNLGARPRCLDCGAQLRRDREAGQRCDPCQRNGPRLLLPDTFYDQPSVTAALAEFDFGVVFRRIRAAQHWSQQTLAEFLDLAQGRVSDIENSKRPLRDLRVVVTVANRLKIPAGKLGFAHGTTVDHAGGQRRKQVSWVDRRDFVGHVAGLTLGAGIVGLDLDRLLALLPHAEPTGTRHVGAADVAAIEQATAEYVRQDHAQGSGLARDGAVAHLRATLPLLGAQMTPEVRPRMLIATAYLATIAGWLNLSGAHAIAGDTDTAVTLGHHAVDAVTALHSPRAHHRLRDLNTALQPLHTRTGVAELRNRLTTTAA